MKSNYLPIPTESLVILVGLSYLWFALFLKRSEMVALGGFLPFMLICAAFTVLRLLGAGSVKELLVQVVVALGCLLPAAFIVWLH